MLLVDPTPRIGLPGVARVALRPEEGFGEAEAIDAALYQDLDVVAVPDVVDTETVEEALRAAMTGHLVILGLDAADSASALEILVDSGIDPDRLAETLLGVTAHRRLPRADGEGRVAIAEVLPATAELRRALREDEDVPVPDPYLAVEAERLVGEGVVAAEERERVFG